MWPVTATKRLLDTDHETKRQKGDATERDEIGQGKRDLDVAQRGALGVLASTTTSALTFLPWTRRKPRYGSGACKVPHSRGQTRREPASRLGRKRVQRERRLELADTRREEHTSQRLGPLAGKEEPA